MLFFMLQSRKTYRRVHGLPVCASTFMDSVCARALCDSSRDLCTRYSSSLRNFVFPSQLRQQNCHIGGPMLSMDMPLVPNYHIIHPYPKIANAKVSLYSLAEPQV